VTPGTGGLSLFDAPVTFGLPGICFKVPSGTAIPAGLAISKDTYRERYKATHYTIHPVFKMRKIHFYFMLKSFELSAVSI
jgi:hypothetical protein